MGGLGAYRDQAYGKETGEEMHCGGVCGSFVCYYGLLYPSTTLCTKMQQNSSMQDIYTFSSRPWRSPLIMPSGLSFSPNTNSNPIPSKSSNPLNPSSTTH